MKKFNRFVKFAEGIISLPLQMFELLTPIFSSTFSEQNL